MMRPVTVNLDHWVSRLGLETDLRKIMETYGYSEGRNDARILEVMV